MLRFLFIVTMFHMGISQQYQQKVPPGVPPQQYQNYQQPPPPPPPQQQMHQQMPQQGYQQQQQYQQMPPQQMQQQQMPQQMHQQQMPQQQMPQQQMPQQQMPQQQMPQQQMHHQPHGDPQLLNPANIAHERDHIQEHMDVPIDTSKMSDQELQFHYFKMHDADNNNKLDGCELIKSLIHWHEPLETDETKDSHALSIVNHILEDSIDTSAYATFSKYKTVVHGPDGQDVESSVVYPDQDLEEIVEGALKQMDKNNDGFIDYIEFRKATV